MAKSLFISYSHRQGEWVWERLVPVLQAAGCADIFIDKTRFTAGFGVKAQMDGLQDKAEVSLLVLTADYLRSEYCCHEMERALHADPDFSRGAFLPVIFDEGGMGVFRNDRFGDPPLWIDFRNDRVEEPWALLLRSLKAGGMGAAASHWLDVRDGIVRLLKDRRQSINLVVHGAPCWRTLIDHLQQEWMPDLAVIDLDAPSTTTRDGLVREILAACGCGHRVPRPPRDLEAFNGLLGLPEPCRLVLLHFENVGHRMNTYGVDLFHVLRYLLEQRKLVLLIESRQPFKNLIPHDHPLSNMNLDSIELRESQA
ncbi:MAG: TIR domain-containing protein [Desulfobacteraceae bacterium]|nr:MAG: TIR domain-containing protein [Desulfobacteraceae bacterium]